MRLAVAASGSVSVGLALALALGPPARAEARYFTIRVVERGSGTPLPGARVETTHHVAHTTDANGLVAFHEPGLMGRPVFFTVTLSGFEAPADALGVRGAKLTAVEGGAATIELARVRPDVRPPNVASTEETSRAREAVPGADRLFRVTCVDAATRRGVPLVELRSGARTWVSDSAGEIALDPAAAAARPTAFTVRAHGYRLQAGAGTVTLEPAPGGRARVALERVNVAERLYRVTGAGIYRDSALLGLPLPLAAPLLAGEVSGQDSVLTALYKGRVFWIWGDTNRISYPLGLFQVAGATSLLPAAGGLDPDRGVDLRYFVGADGFARAMAPNPRPMPGLTWLSGLVTVPDAARGEALVARYAKLRKLGETYEEGLVRYDDASETFREVAVLAPGEPIRRGDCPYVVAHAGGRWVYHHDHVRVAATAEAATDPGAYEAFTPLGPGGEVERDASGAPRYRWRRRTRLVGKADLERGLLSAREALDGHLRDVSTGAAFTPHENGCTAPNAFRGRFVRLVMQVGGASSYLGELYYLEADTPVGPWVWARKVVTHDRYTFYNPRLHPFFDRDGGRVVYFEGTYTDFAAGAPAKTPRYDYNQIMYRLDLADERLVLPVAVYDLAADGPPGDFATRAGLRPGRPAPRPAFFAPDRPAPGLVPVGWSGAACAPRRLVAGMTATAPLFFAAPAAGPRPPGVIPLVEHVEPASGRRAYAVGGSAAPPGFARAATVAHVWPNPQALALPAHEHRGPLVADAGPDRCLDAPGAVTLDGSRSSRAGGAIARHEWSWRDAGGERRASGPTPEVTLGPGLHRIALRVTDADGGEDHDEMLVQVGPAADPPLPAAPSGGCGCGAARAGGTVPLLAALALLAVGRRRGRSGRALGRATERAVEPFSSPIIDGRPARGDTGAPTPGAKPAPRC